MVKENNGWTSLKACHRVWMQSGNMSYTLFGNMKEFSDELQPVRFFINSIWQIIKNTYII